MIKSASRSSLVEDVKYTSMSAGVVPSSEYLISTTVLTQNEPSVTFDVSSFAGVYRHLQIIANVRSTAGANAVITFNGDTSANYSWHLVYGNGSTVLSTGAANSSNMILFSQAPSTANIFLPNTIDILDFANNSKNKTIRSLCGAPSLNEIALFSGAWRNTAPVTSITISLTSFVAGSRFSIYGVV